MLSSQMASFVEKSKKNKKKGEMFFSIALAYSCPNIVSFIGATACLSKSL